MAACHDPGQGPAVAARGVPVTLEQGLRTWELGSADAAEDSYALRLMVAVPGDAELGEAQLRVGSARPVPLSIVADAVPRAAPAMSASAVWASPGTIALTTWDSSSCPTRWAPMERVGDQAVEVRVLEAHERVCTADAVRMTRGVAVPAGVSTAAPLTVVVHHRVRSERLTLQPPEPGR